MKRVSGDAGARRAWTSSSSVRSWGLVFDFGWCRFGLAYTGGMVWGTQRPVATGAVFFVLILLVVFSCGAQVVDLVAPDRGVDEGGEQVLILGSGLLDVAEVRFGDFDATLVRPVSDIALVALMPDTGLNLAEGTTFPVMERFGSAFEQPRHCGAVWNDSHFGYGVFECPLGYSTCSAGRGASGASGV